MDALIAATLDFLLYVGASSLYHILILFGPGLVLGFLLNRVSAIVEVSANKLLGVLYFWVFESFGTTVHEVGHAIFSLIFFRKVSNFKPFIPDRSSRVRGEMSSKPDPRNLYKSIGNFFIGVGPIIFGTVLIYLAGRFFLGSEIFSPLSKIDFDAALLSSADALTVFLQNAADQIIAILKSIFAADNLRNWRFYAFLYIAFSVGSTMTLSPYDLCSVRASFALLAAVIFALNFGAAALGVFVDGWFLRISSLYAGFYAMMAFALIIVSVFALIFGALRFLTGR